MSRSSPTSQAHYYRQDGVRITHDPYSPAMASKYGLPGATDSEGFDPYRDTVGPGIYGGIVKRDEAGQVIQGKQYQNHNPRPGPVYAGGGYTPVNAALKDVPTLSKLLALHPDLANDVSTGGAQPLHMCGMGRDNQKATSTLISHGSDIEALDTYGMTPLHRMASNNLALGAKALLQAGADPNHKGTCGATPLEIAASSAARDVIQVLQHHQAHTVPIAKVVVLADTKASQGNNGEKGVLDNGVDNGVGGVYEPRGLDVIPVGFRVTCEEMGWNTDATWTDLAGGSAWFSAVNGAYMYWNKRDGCWWIDAPDGKGVFKASAPSHAPPGAPHSWSVLQASFQQPTVLTFRDLAR